MTPAPITMTSAVLATTQDHNALGFMQFAGSTGIPATSAQLLRAAHAKDDIVPRHRRLFIDGFAYHVLNRGNRRQVIFRKSGDYRAFLTLIAEACSRHRMPLLALCLMNNHWHLVLWPDSARSISAYMHWLLNTHVHRYHLHYGLTGQGHLYQDRYKAFPIQDDRHLFTVLRYVEANPLRAGLVKQAEHWIWSSLGLRTRDEWTDLFGCEQRVQLPGDWSAIVNGPLARPELRRLRESTKTGAPFGDAEWAERLRKKGTGSLTHLSP